MARPIAPPHYVARCPYPEWDDMWDVIEVSGSEETVIASCDTEVAAKAIASALNEQRALMAARRLFADHGMLWSSRN